jgi:hypothetical protein
MDTIAQREFLGTCVSSSASTTEANLSYLEEGDMQWLISTFQFSEPPIDQLTRRTLFRYIRLVSMALVVILAVGAERGNIFEGQVSPGRGSAG